MNVLVEDIEKTLNKAKELGGKIVKENTEIPNVGLVRATNRFDQMETLSGFLNRRCD